MTAESMTVRALAEVVDGLVDDRSGLGPDALGDAALADELLALRRQIDRLEARFARLAWAAHRRGIGAADGSASTGAWLRWRAGMREGEARMAIEAGETCELLPEAARAWAAGEISSGAARTIVAARVPDHDDEFIVCEPVLLDLARRGDLRSLRRAAAHFRNLAQADGAMPAEHDGLHLSRTYGGRSVLSAELSDAAAETVTVALHAYVDPPTEGEARSTSQRYAAALVRICETAIAHAGSVGRPRPHVSLVVDWSTLTQGTVGRIDGEFTGPMHPREVQRLLCDASISRIVTGPDGLPLDVGRTRRTVPPSLRRALVVRDGGCRFPGCDRPPGWCEAHHVVHWINGGRTAVYNLILFCGHHHRVLHQPGWEIKFNGFDLQVFRPDGVRLDP